MLKSRYHAWLIPYVEGTLDANRRVVLEKRMASDPKLAAEAEALRRVTSHLRRSAIAEPPIAAARPVWPRVQQRLQKRGPAPLVSPRLAWGGAAAIALGLVFAANQHPQPSDDYGPVSRVAAAPQHGGFTPFSALPSIGALPFGAAGEPWGALPSHMTQPPGDPHASLEKMRAPKLARGTVSGTMPPLPIQFTGRVVGPANSADSHFAGFGLTTPAQSTPIPLTLARAPRLSPPTLSASTQETDNLVATAIAPRAAFASPMTASTGSERAPKMDAPNGDGARMSATGATSVPPPSPRMAFASPSPTDIRRPDPISTQDAIGVAGVNRFFLSLPAGARATSRSLMSLGAVTPLKMLTSAESVETLRDEARAQQSRGQAAAALDTWRDAVFVSLTPPTYADEQSAAQAMQTLSIAGDAGQLADLRARLERQQEFAPDDIVSLRALGYLYTLSGDVEQARGVWRQVTASGQGAGEDWYQLAGSELMNGDTAAARVAYANAVLPAALPPASAHRAAAQRWLTNSAH